jgi:hypothetical protein
MTNDHLKPELRSSMVALTYWHQGMERSFTQGALGLSFIYRGKKWVTAQLGLARQPGSTARDAALLHRGVFVVPFVP